ncbi:DNA-methyltransferase [Sphingomonas sp. Marseille-Q8236]
MTYEVLHGDCRALMAEMEGCSVDSVVTDPPYELTSARPGGRSPATQGKVMKGFMGMEWDGSGVAFDPETWAAALRVLKPGGWLVAFSGARTYHRMACAIEDAGFEIRDQIMWIYGSGFPKGGNRGGKGTCLKPAHEPIVLARKPLIGSVAANEAAFATGALSIDACRVGWEGGIAPQIGTPGWGGPAKRLNAAPGQDGETVERSGPNALGRWPANVVHDGSDDVLAAFPDAPGQQGDLRGHAKCRQSPNGIFGGMRPALDHAARGDTGTAARFFYCAKASKADRDEGLSAFAPQAFVQFQTGNGESGNASSLSAGRDTVYRNTHPTVKPEALMRWLVRLITPPGGRVLDPFTGSGSTGKAAVLEGFDFMGCELTAEYLPIANARIAAAVARAEQAQAAAPQYDMFDGAAA